MCGVCSALRVWRLGLGVLETKLKSSGLVANVSLAPKWSCCELAVCMTFAKYSFLQNLKTPGVLHFLWFLGHPGDQASLLDMHTRFYCTHVRCAYSNLEWFLQSSMLTDLSHYTSPLLKPEERLLSFFLSHLTSLHSLSHPSFLTICFTSNFLKFCL